MQNEEKMCYITYMVPARMLPAIPLAEAFAPIEASSHEPERLYPEGFMPDWFLNGKFPEDDYED